MNLPALVGTLAPNKSRGAALIIMLFVVVLASTAILVSLLAKTNPDIERQKKTMAALAQAKQALIAWSVTRGDMQLATEITAAVTKYTYYPPGSLPWPDPNYFGSENSGFASGSCSSSGGSSIGRLPWRSLRIDKLIDGSGEPLWYALSDNFRRANGLNDKAINSDTKGSLLLYAADGSTLLTPAGEELAAIIFAPGSPLPEQDRAALPNAAKSYLDAHNSKDNANAAGPFFAGPVRDSNGNLISNDVVVGISARELTTAVELRALKEAQRALASYKTANGKYPNPAPYNGANCASLVDDVKDASLALCKGDSVVPTCIGRFPEDIFPYYPPANARPLELSGQLKIAPWFTQNGWGRTMTYAINDKDSASPTCTTSISVAGTNKDNGYILIAPGPARGTQTRPSYTLSDYLEDAGNTDAWSGNGAFVTPTAASNDHLRSAP